MPTKGKPPSLCIALVSPATVSLASTANNTASLASPWIPSTAIGCSRQSGNSACKCFQIRGLCAPPPLTYRVGEAMVKGTRSKAPATVTAVSRVSVASRLYGLRWPFGSWRRAASTQAALKSSGPEVLGKGAAKKGSAHNESSRPSSTLPAKASSASSSNAAPKSARAKASSRVLPGPVSVAKAFAGSPSPGRKVKLAMPPRFSRKRSSPGWENKK